MDHFLHNQQKAGLYTGRKLSLARFNLSAWPGLRNRAPQQGLMLMIIG